MGSLIKNHGRGCPARARLAAALLLGVCFSWLAIAQNSSPALSPPTGEEFFAHHDHIIGTSLDLWIVASDEAAASACELAILREIERLRLIFSTFDPQSEISQLNRAQETVAVSAEMLEVLRRYGAMQVQSRGAFNGQLGDLVSTWKAAEKAGAEPDPFLLKSLVMQINRPGWKIDEQQHTVTRLTDQPLNLNSIAKGYIIQKAAAAARHAVPSLKGLLLNLGGDMFAWGQNGAGQTSWSIGVQNPFHSEDNAPPLAILKLHQLAIATSGGYERYYKINGQRYSHIFDPRTGWPAAGVASATVVARDNVTANALATTLCVLSPQEGLDLVAATAGTECLIVAADGVEYRSPGLQALETALPRPIGGVQGPKGDAAWPEGNQVSIAITLPAIASGGRAYRRPYVALWVETADAKPLRTIAVWGTKDKYLKDLTTWWKIVRDDKPLVTAVTRATRPPGSYTLIWDGTDNKGKAVPQGTYTIRIEVHREHGGHTMQTGKLDCRANPVTLTLDKNAEIDATKIEYGKKKQP